MSHATSPAPRVEYANDASYESVHRLLYKLAIKCFARVQAMGLPMAFEDVHQEMNVSYVRAREKWKPDAGVKFSTYLTYACYNNFNDAIARMERERRELGLVSLSSFTRRLPDADDLDPLECIDAQDASASLTLETSSVFEEAGLTATDADATPAPLHANPEQVLDHRQQVRENMRGLTQVTRSLVVEIIAAAHAGKDLPPLKDLAEKRGLAPAELRRIKAEITKAFGVKF